MKYLNQIVIDSSDLDLGVECFYYLTHLYMYALDRLSISTDTPCHIFGVNEVYLPENIAKKLIDTGYMAIESDKINLLKYGESNMTVEKLLKKRKQTVERVKRHKRKKKGE